MTPAALKYRPSAGALRAASEIQPDGSLVESTAEIIDRETGLRDLLALIEEMVAQAGDLIESRSPELVAQARAVLRYSGDAALRRAE